MVTTRKEGFSHANNNSHNGYFHLPDDEDALCNNKLSSVPSNIRRCRRDYSDSWEVEPSVAARMAKRKRSCSPISFVPGRSTRGREQVEGEIWDEKPLALSRSPNKRLRASKRHRDSVGQWALRSSQPAPHRCPMDRTGEGSGNPGILGIAEAAHDDASLRFQTLA